VVIPSVTEAAKLTNLLSIPLCLLLLLAGESCLAVDSSKQITQFAHTAWRIQDGFFSGAPTAIAQTKDGYIWIGTVAGLLRFDGVHFVEWNPPGAKQLSDGVFSLLGGSDGSLWIGTGTHLARLKDGHLIDYLGARGRINSILEDRSGTVWIARSRVHDAAGPLCEVAGEKLQCHGKGDGITPSYAGPLINDDAGNLWIGSSSVLTRWKAGLSETYANPALKSAQGLAGVQALASNSDGTLFVGIIERGPGLGLQQFVNGTWKPWRTSTFDGSTLEVNALLLDREKSLWIGTTNQGIFRFRDGKLDHFFSANGLSGDTVNGFYEDREGDLWVATDDGIDCFRSTPVVSFSTREGLSANMVDSVLADRHGAVWIGNGSLESVHEGTVTSIGRKNGLPGGRVTSLLEDHAGHLWVGVDNGLSIYEGGKFTPILRRDGTPIGTIIELAEDQDGNIWAEAIGSPVRLLRIKDRILREEIPASEFPAVSSFATDAHDGIWLGLVNGDLARYRHGPLETFPVRLGQNAGVRQFLVDLDDSILGATSAGLIGWKAGVVRTLTVRNGLPCDGVYGLISDNQDNLWLYMNCGLVRVERSELQKWWQDADAVVQVRVFDAFDGARPSGSSFRPRSSRSPDGRLWFANGNVLQMIDPAHLAENAIPPPVRVETIIADRKVYSAEGYLQLAPITRDLEIDYTALSFVAPQKVRFRYKLDGHDVNWQDPGTRRQAFYSDLPPGKYRFHVIACNNDGVWNQAGATLDFRVMPAWYQTILFRVVCVAAVLFIAWAIHLFRVRQIARVIGARFDERLAERTQIARDLHDTLLQTIQGSKLVANDALDKRSGEVKMRFALEQLSLWLEQATQEVRMALNSLRSSTELRNDLAEAFQRAAGTGPEAGSLAATLSVVGNSREMHPIVRDEIYRIGFEAIRNAQMHSGGSRLEVELRYDLDLVVRVRDNGRGIEPGVSRNGRDGHFGLQGMRERAARIGGRLSIIGSSEFGTEVHLEVPGQIAFLNAGTAKFSTIRALFRRKTEIPKSQ
jgi:signal transduction histidine kinase/ligand-binding sensor domain-containing protein